MSTAVSVATRTAGAHPIPNKDLVLLLTAAQLDIAALRAAVVAITAKLDADGGVTDTNYAATTNPAALRFLP